ncbi:MAG: NUDIX hydrolase [Chloroflexota bacterium]
MTGQTGADPFSDPNELFDVYDNAGHPTGRVKRRAEVHRDGDWHRSFHCWVTCDDSAARATAGAGPALLLQRRGRHKDTWPGRLDVSVGGHYRAGETLSDVVREVEEEIGQATRLEELLPLGHRVCVNEQEPGTLDHELQDVFLWPSSLPLSAFRPQPVEVTALEAASVPDLLRLLSGQTASIRVRVLRPDLGMEDGAITANDFIPTFDRYFYRVAMLVDLAGRGYPHLVV